MSQNDTLQPSPTPEHPRDPLWKRAIFMGIIAVMVSFAQSILILVAIIQFVVLLLDQRQPNPRIAEFGVMVGDWVAGAARYLSVASDAKPWPFNDAD
ncbi:MAG: DUF4389 domain-containing protein [Roseinatronobacter sp.]